MSYALKLAAAGIALLIAGAIVIMIFEGVWLRVGFAAGFAIVCGALLFLAWSVDRKDRKARAGLEDLPNV